MADRAGVHPVREGQSGKVTFSNAGNGTIPHVAAGAFAETIGAQLEHIPYNGSAPAIMGLLAGDVQATTVAYAELRQYVESGSCARWR